MMYRTYAFPAGKVMWRVENHPEFILLGERTNIAKASIVGAAITEPSYTIPPPKLFTSLESAEVFPKLTGILQLIIVYDPPEGGARSFAVYTLLPNKAECCDLIADLREELGDRMLGVGPAQLVADRLGVGDIHRRIAGQQKKALLIFSVLLALGLTLLIVWRYSSWK